MNTLEKYNLWLDNANNPYIYKELISMQKNPQEIEESFYKELEFGTAGLRGILGAGTNRMNIYTVAQATQGFSKYLCDNFFTPSVAIAYDSRHMSKEFGDIVAQVFSANGIKVHLFQELIPTPMLSYAVRELKCCGGVVITASHNPAKYNGYKAYNNEGCQIDGKIADAIVANIRQVDIFSDIKTTSLNAALETGMVEYISDDLGEKYLKDILSFQFNKDITKKSDLSVVYTPLYGAGYKWVTAAMSQIGIKNLYVVKEQSSPNGDFPTCPYPNPEFTEALELGLNLCKKKGADMLIASDPDADRIGVAVLESGSYRILTGDEVGILLLDYICKARIEKGLMPKNPVSIKSVVSSKMTDVIAKVHGVRLKSVLTGFKNIGEYMKELENIAEDTFIYAYEESCGYLGSNFVRDKDAINAAALFVEMGAWYKAQGISVAQAMDNLYEKYGYYISKSISYSFGGITGETTMKNIMKDLRETPIKELCGDSTIKILDYNNGTAVEDNMTKDIQLPKTNMLEYFFSSGNSIMIRPSGTEPKIKVYYFVSADKKDKAQDLFVGMSGKMQKLIDKYTI